MDFHALLRNFCESVEQMAGGGMLIEGGGSILGAIGVSDAPGGETDEACAKAGIAAILEAIEF